MGLEGHQKKEIMEALKSAFPNRNELVMMLSLELDMRESEVLDNSSYNFVVFKLIERFESQDRIQELIEGACRANPGNLDLQKVAKKMKTPSEISISVSLWQICSSNTSLAN
ncbi:effector-associated domain EAD1-containing protein [Scytonema sp. NUACC26]|uniref:effector-associated domain EAD1-containing protein n=1 Tax=Scytonema sp. NUACC26 TaxID=3140176 RepID=UPI0034DC0C02